MSKKKTLSVLLNSIVALIIMIFIIKGFHYMKKISSGEDELENLYYIMQILGSFVVIIGGIVGVWQYILSKRAESNRYNNSRIQKAIDLSEYYKDNILCNISFIYHVYRESKILDILNQVNRNSMKDFDVHELQNIFSKKQEEEIAKIINSEKFIDIIIKWSDVYSKDQICKSIIVKKGDRVVEAKEINKAKVIDYFINNVICETLNNMEFFSMHFNYETADEKVVYQSLHKTYLEMVRLLYYDISSNNKTGEQKLFTNVIELYNKWKKKSDLQYRKETNVSRNNVLKGPRATSA